MAYEPFTDRLTRIEYPVGQWFEFTYDAVGRRASRTDETGRLVRYEYDGLGRLDRMFEGASILIVDYDYESAGRLQRKTLGNGVFTTYSYDAAGHVDQVVNFQPNGAVLSQYDYEYDVSGRRTAMITLGGRFDYGYDALGQLVSVRHPDGRMVIYDYDAAGNRRQVIDDSTATAYTTNDLNQYTQVGGVTYAFDADGNLISQTENGVKTTYTYDMENRLVGVTTPTDSWKYTYDAFGNRVAAIYNGQTTQYVIDPTGFRNVAAESDGSGNVIARYDHGYGLLSRIDISGPAFYTFQGIGHTSEVTDATGEVLNDYAFGPWGESLTKSEVVANPFQFAGEYGVMSDGHGGQLTRARLYNPAIGRFQQQDPLGIPGGSNLYGYADNSPNYYVDPIGLFPHRVIQPGRGQMGIGRMIVDPIGEVDLPWRALWNQFDGACTGVPDLIYREACEQHDRRYGPEGDLSRLEADLEFLGNMLEINRRRGLSGFAPAIIPYVYFGGVRLFGPAFYQPSPSVSPLQYLPVLLARSRDPNDKLAPTGFGDAAFIQSGGTLDYTIRFENQPEATGPAREIIVTDILDENLDLDTFQLTEIAFADQRIAVPAGLSQFETVLAMTANGEAIRVEVATTLDRDARAR